MDAILMSTAIAGLTFQFTYSRVPAGGWGRGVMVFVLTYARVVLPTHVTHQPQLVNRLSAWYFTESARCFVFLSPARVGKCGSDDSSCGVSHRRERSAACEADWCQHL